MALSELGVPDFLRDRTAGQTRKEIERRQSELLPEAISAAARSRFWARRFEEAGVKPEAVRRPADLYGLPTLDKARYMAALEADRFLATTDAKGETAKDGKGKGGEESVAAE